MGDFWVWFSNEMDKTGSEPVGLAVAGALACLVLGVALVVTVVALAMWTNGWALLGVAAAPFAYLRWRYRRSVK